MKKIWIIAAFCRCVLAAEIHVSESEQPNAVFMALRVKADDVVLIRTIQGPTAAVRFLSLSSTNVTASWCYIGDKPMPDCNDGQDFPLRPLPNQTRVKVDPTGTRRSIQSGVFAEGEIKAGDIIAKISLSSSGEFGLEYCRQKAELGFLPSQLPPQKSGPEKK